MVAAAHAAPGPDRAAASPSGAPDNWDIAHVGFADVLATLNPLQYLPVVGTIYREVTGESAHPAFRIAAAGAAAILVGGPIGIAATMIGAAFDEIIHAGPTATDAGHRAMLASRAYGRLARAA